MDLVDGCDCRELKLEKLNLAGRSLRESTFDACIFQSCACTEADFHSATLEDCTFLQCDLSLAGFKQARLQGVTFRGCKILGVQFLHCAPFALALAFEGCQLRSCNFSEMKLKGTRFTDCRITECDFVRTDLRECDFQKSVFTDTTFNGCDMRKARFAECRGYSINPVSNNVRKAVFSLPDAVTLLEHLGVIIK